MEQDIRWKQRFDSFNKAYQKLSEGIELVTESSDGTDLDRRRADIIKEGLIQRFEYTSELSWKLMKDYANYQGALEIKGSRDAIREAFKMGLITGAEEWILMLESRHLTSHTYDETTSQEIISNIINKYAQLFEKFKEKMKSLL